MNNSKALDDVTIPDGVTSIGRHALADSTLKTVKIPASVTDIGDHVFSFFTEDHGLVIYGVEDSYAERYAEEHEILFKES